MKFQISSREYRRLKDILANAKYISDTSLKLSNKLSNETIGLLEQEDYLYMPEFGYSRQFFVNNHNDVILKLMFVPCRKFLVSKYRLPTILLAKRFEDLWVLQPWADISDDAIDKASDILRGKWTPRGVNHIDGHSGNVCMWNNTAYYHDW